MFFLNTIVLKKKSWHVSRETRNGKKSIVMWIHRTTLIKNLLGSTYIPPPQPNNKKQSIRAAFCCFDYGVICPNHDLRRREWVSKPKRKSCVLAKRYPTKQGAEGAIYNCDAQRLCDWGGQANPTEPTCRGTSTRHGAKGGIFTLINNNTCIIRQEMQVLLFTFFENCS